MVMTALNIIVLLCVWTCVVMNINRYLGRNPLPPSLALSRGDGGNTLLQNFEEFLPNHTVSHPGLQ